MKSNPAGSLIDRIEHGAQVAKPGKDFWIPLDQAKIQMGKKLHAAIPAPLRQDDLNLFIQKGLVDLFDFLASRRHPGNDTPIHHLKAQLLKILYAVREIFLLFNQPAGCYRIHGSQTNLLPHGGFPRHRTDPWRPLPAVFFRPISELIIIAPSSQEIST